MAIIGIDLGAADTTCYQAERLLADYGDRLAAEAGSRVETGLRDPLEALAKREAALASERAESLRRILQGVGATLYAEGPRSAPRPHPDVGTGPGEACPSGAGPRGRVIDAEYRESRS